MVNKIRRKKEGGEFIEGMKMNNEKCSVVWCVGLMGIKVFLVLLEETSPSTLFIPLTFSFCFYNS